MLVNNLFDKTLLFEVFTTLTIFSGLIFAMYNEEELKQKVGLNLLINIGFALAFFRIFLYIQKRVHKEIFFEMKQRSSEQDEFKTIFNELDEGILITQNNRISKFNNLFQHLISTYFDKKTIKKVRQISDAKDQIHLDKDIQKNQSRILKF